MRDTTSFILTLSYYLSQPPSPGPSGCRHRAFRMHGHPIRKRAAFFPPSKKFLRPWRGFASAEATSAHRQRHAALRHVADMSLRPSVLHLPPASGSQCRVSPAPPAGTRSCPGAGCREPASSERCHREPFPLPRPCGGPGPCDGTGRH